MTQRTRKRKIRCEGCRLHTHRCICSQIPTFHLQTKIILVMHRREQHKPTASAPLALKALPNHHWMLHGYRDQPATLVPHVSDERRGLVLYPSENAKVLSQELLAADPRPVTLVVPDGNWGQARRLARRIPGIESFEPVILPAGPPTRYHLRREPKEAGLATFEAIARALGVLESLEVQHQLEALFDSWVDASFAMRGTTNPAGTPL